MLVEDEDEFAMLAETLFTELDTDDSGKLSRNELRPAILQLGIEQGVPPAAGVLSLSLSLSESLCLSVQLLGILIILQSMMFSRLQRTNPWCLEGV
jgi:hypothetical protein